MRWRAVLPWLFAVIGVLLLVLPLIGTPEYVVTLATLMLIYGIAAMALDILVGFTGLVSFAQGAFFGVAAYGVGVATTEMGITNFFAVSGFSVMLAVGLSVIVGLIALRAKGVGFIILTLAINELMWGLAYQWVAVSGGDNGLIGFVRPELFGISLSGTDSFYWFSFGVLAITGALMYLVVRSPFGLALKGIREQPRRMKALGYNVWVYQYMAFIVAAFFAGIAGVLIAYYNEFVGTSILNLAQSTQFLIMTILGGTGTLWGSLLGSGIIVALQNVISNYTMRWEMILGAIYVAVVMWAPEGILGVAQRLLTRRRRGRTAAKGVVEVRPGDEGTPQEGKG